MKKKQVMLALTLVANLSLSGGLTSCDDGNITEDMQLNINDGYIVRLTGTPQNLKQWDNENYQIVVASFAAQDSYPLLAKALPMHEKKQDYTFEGINPESETIELCVLNLINKRVATLATLYDKGEDGERALNDTIRYSLDGKDVGMYATIQQNIFNKRCAYCHGMGETPAAGLYLTAEKSYESLVGTASQKVEGKSRVEPNNANESILYRVLTEYDANSPWHYNHTKFFYGSTMSNLVKEWINNGAAK